MARRIVAFFCILLLLGGGLGLRVLRIALGESVATTSSAQSTRTGILTQSRGDIVDRDGEKLVNEGGKWKLLIFPELLSTKMLAEFTKDPAFVEAAQRMQPVVVDRGGEVREGEGIFPFREPVRYRGDLAAHLIGYLQDGAGAAGLEKAYDDLLKNGAQPVTVTYSADGTGRLLSGEPITVSEPDKGKKTGLVLTIDKEIQSAAEKVLKENLAEGAVVVLDAESGEIRAAASVPGFEPGNLAASLQKEGAPFLNRAFSAYSVGSTWKLVVVAAALEAGISPNRIYNCQSKIEIGGLSYHCHWKYGHGEIDMETALRVSCNPYFIDLAEELGGDGILSMAQSLGFGMPTALGPDWNTAAGNLPTKASLASPTVLASFAFGQGTLLATPLQLAALSAAIANGGFAVTPKLVAGTYGEDGVFEPTADYPPNRVMSEKTAETLQKMMVAVVENGSGEKAKPKNGSAGGKTASAQTGQYRKDGSEIIHGWFVGFYPAEDPRFALAVLAEGKDSGGDFAAPVFRELCERIGEIY